MNDQLKRDANHLRTLSTMIDEIGLSEVLGNIASIASAKAYQIEESGGDTLSVKTWRQAASLILKLHRRREIRLVSGYDLYHTPL